MNLKALLSSQRADNSGCISVPGVWDGFTARMASRMGFEITFLSGAAFSMARYGKPDLAFHGLSELADAVRLITSASPARLIVDGDTGFGNALHVKNTVQTLERAGAAAIQLEDQTFPKRCGHLTGKSVIPLSEAADKIKASVDARKTAETLISARTDAIATEGIHAAIDRAEAYLEAGADLIFIEGPRTIEELNLIASTFAERVPLIHNLVDGANTPVTTRQALSEAGYALALHPLILLSALAGQGEAALAHLKAEGETRSLSQSLPDLNQLNERLGLSSYIDDTRKYEG